MKIPHDLPVRDKCQRCDLRGTGFFCQLSEKELPGFESLKITKAYAKGTMLFVQGQSSALVYTICRGKVKLSTCSPDGKIIILEIAKAGDIIGLSAAVNDLDHESTAEVIEACQVIYAKTSDFMQFLKTDPAACMKVARQLGRNYQTAYRQICSLALSDSVADKLAKLLLGWSGTGGDERVRLKNFYTHEDMAEMIGSSRETVTRALKYFRDNDLITLKGTDLVIIDRQRLRAMIGSHGVLHAAV